MNLQSVEDVVRSITELSRTEMIRRLADADRHAKHVAAAGRRARRDTPARDRVPAASEHIARYGRILYFLQHADGQLAQGATPADVLICRQLAENLKARGEWTGSIP
jgi:hypothetical protein